MVVTNDKADIGKEAQWTGDWSAGIRTGDFRSHSNNNRWVAQGRDR